MESTKTTDNTEANAPVLPPKPGKLMNLKSHYID